MEHLPDAPVGSVFGLYQSRAGLFSAASITSGDFLSLLDSIYHDCDIAQSQRLPLPREPKVEALHAWLPSLSLASLHPDIPQTTADGGKLSFFDHVSICALGRRRGTTAVYGTDLAWVLKHFSDLEPSIAAQIENDANAAKRESGCPEDHPLPLTKLIAKAIDAGFLRKLRPQDRRKARWLLPGGKRGAAGPRRVAGFASAVCCPGWSEAVS